MQRILATVLLSAVFMACPQGVGGVVKASIGPSGGTLEHPGGARLVVPAGALASTVELSIEGKPTPGSDTLGATPVGAAFVLGPEGQQFLSPVQVVLAYEPSQVPPGSSLAVLISPQSTNDFSALPTTVDEPNRRLSASTTHFSVVVSAATGAAQACTSLVNSASAVSEQQVPQSGPTPAGGTVVTGIYHLTSLTRFTGAGGAATPTGEQRQQTLRIVTTSATGATIEVVERNVGTGEERRFSGLVVLNGSALSLTRTCPSADADTLGFTFTNDTLDVIEPDGTATKVTRFTRQASLDAGVDDGGVAGACASVPRVGPTTGEYLLPSAAPTPAGGAVESGTFVRMGALIYTGAGGASGPTGTPRQQSLGIVATSATAGLFEENSKRTTDAVETQRAYTFSTSGAQLTLTMTCPSNVGQMALGYSLADGRLDVFEPTSGGTRVTTFLKLLADGGVPAWDAGLPTLDAGVDAGLVDAGTSAWTVVGSGLTDLVDLDLDATDVYTLGGGEVRRCAQAGCGTGHALVVATFASSLAVANGTLWLSTDFRNLKTCALGGTCTLAVAADLGANSYPAHLSVANSRMYFLWESGASRRIGVCPLAGCTTGYPKVVYQGTELDGLAVSGLGVTATDAYVSSYTGGIYRVPLTDPETAVATGTAQAVGTGFGTGGLEVDGATARWTNVTTGDLESCALPACATVTKLFMGLGSATGVRSSATHLYGISRGNPTGNNTWQAGTATIYRTPK